MKIALAQLNYTIGDFSRNLEKIKQATVQAAADGAEMIVFSELAVCGYPPMDLLDYPAFVSACQQAMESLRPIADNIVIIVGAPSVNPVLEGKDLFNSAWVLEKGEVKQLVNKTLLPTYDVFDEYRWFEQNNKFDLVVINGKRIALTICEDLWNVDYNPMYEASPMEQLTRLNADLAINIAASPFNYQQRDERRKILKANVAASNLPMIYVNQVGAQAELVFDGGSLVMNARGEVIRELPYFKEEVAIIDTDSLQPQYAGIPSKEEMVHQALVLGIRDYFSKMGFKKAILGSSGGIDSALVQALACEALGPENVMALLLPSRYSSDGSVSDAEQLCKNLGNPYEIVPISAAVDAFEQTLALLFTGQAADITEENIQSRSRAVFLMAYSNKFGHMLLNTSNKSEMAVGYGTLYGDMCGGISVIGDVYKTEVYNQARYINCERELIPPAILEKAPSAELRPDQKDTDSLPPYDILDAILYQYIEEKHSLEQIVALGFDRSLVEDVLKKVNRNEYKRRQAPPVLRVSHKAFGPGRRIPIVARYNF